MELTNHISTQSFKNVVCNFKVWLRNSRMVALPQSLLPAIAAVCVAFADSTNMTGLSSNFNIYLAVIAVIGVTFGHLGSNLFDDYFDYRHKRTDYRDTLAHKGMRSRIAKCEYLTSGRNTLGQLLSAAIIFCCIALFIGLVVWYFRGNHIIYIAAIAAFFGYSYSGKPIKFSYHGFGEIVIGLMFGPLLMTGVFFTCCGIITPSILLVSSAVGLLVVNIIYTHSILDFTPDKEINKRTLAVLINNKWGMLAVAFLINFLPFIIIAVAVSFGMLNMWYILIFLAFPMAINLFYMMVQYTKFPKKEFSPKFWMGPMEKWEQKQKYGIGWFMIRWMLARNLASFFCLIIALISIVIGLNAGF